MSDFVMPSLGADMEAGKVVQWLVEAGSKVKSGDVVAVVETHKGAIEVEIFEAGEITELCVGLDEEVPVGTVLARVQKAGEATPAGAPEAAKPAEPVKPMEPAKAAEPTVEAAAKEPAPAVGVKQPVPAPAPVAAPSGARAKVTPVGRRRAAELGIDADGLHGTGIDGSVTLADVELAATKAKAAAPAEPAASGAPKPRTGFDPALMRQAIASAMSRSKREIPHYYLGTTLDMGPVQAWLAEYNRARTPDARLLPVVPVLKAIGLALKSSPGLNGFWEDGAFRPSATVHVGWAVALRGGGLIAPAIRDVDTRGLRELMEAMRDLVARARGGGLRGSELTDPSFTVTSLGDRGAESVFGVIYPPQVAILGLGRIADRPWVVDGAVAVRPLMSVSLAADHRASDGHAGGLFLAKVAELLQEPEKL